MEKPKFGNEYFENKEEREKPKWDNIKVFSVRHGDTPYIEQLRGKIKEGEVDLTEKGIEQIRTSAEKIAQRLDKENDVIWVIESPRKRTRDSGDIVSDYLEKNGFLVWIDPKKREVQQRIRSTDLVNEELDEPIPPSDEKHVEFFKKVLIDIEQMMSDTETMSEVKEMLPEELKNKKITAEQLLGLLGHLPGLEKFSDVQKRGRDQLAYLTRIAHIIQPKIDKHIAIIQMAHAETMDELFEKASKGEYTFKKQSGMEKGEVVQLNIPTKGDEIEVDFIDRGHKSSMIKFNHLKREFIDYENK